MAFVKKISRPNIDTRGTNIKLKSGLELDTSLASVDMII